MPLRHYWQAVVSGIAAIWIISGMGMTSGIALADALDEAIAGQEAIDQGDYRLAILYTERALQSGRLDTTNQAIAHYNLGYARYHTGALAESIGNYTTALNLGNPDTALVYNNRGNSYYYLGQWQNAVADYSQAISQRPDYASAYFYRGLAQEQLGQRAAALADLQQADRLLPGNPTIREKIAALSR